jgi:hypothetical protein
MEDLELKGIVLPGGRLLIGIRLNPIERTNPSPVVYG